MSLFATDMCVIGIAAAAGSMAMAKEPSATPIDVAKAINILLIEKSLLTTPTSGPASRRVWQ
jgi:hypothetical protein